MLRLLSKIVLKLIGWKLNLVQPDARKFVLIGAPHTSNWDFPLALLAFWNLNQKIHWVAKIQMFWGPLGYLFTALGGIPVDRSKSHGFIQQIAARFSESDEMVVAIAPEGTRSKTDYWKSGFYHLAIAARVPICLAYVDYASKTLGCSDVWYPSGDIDADMHRIAAFYSGIVGKRPQNQGLVRLNQ